MSDTLIHSWPFLLLLFVFVVFGVLMVRSMGHGKKGMSYIDLMARQVELFEAQIALQHDMRELMTRQTEALEKIAAKNQDTYSVAADD